jgi:hypothetical protein
MLIRSQQKKQICNLDTAHSLWIHEQNGKFNIMMSFNNDSDYGMGTYFTETKAIKVLDMIQSCYTAFENRTTGSYDYTDCCVFQMPSDEEVEE